MANVFHDVFQLILNNLYLIGVLALSTMGITLTYKTTNVANFSQAITSTIGAYMAGLMVRDFGCNPWLAMVAGVLLCFVIGVLVDAVVVRNIGGGSGRTAIRQHRGRSPPFSPRMAPRGRQSRSAPGPPSRTSSSSSGSGVRQTRT